MPAQSLNQENQSDAPETVIRAERGVPGVDFRELWSYRELFWALAMRTVRVRYKQTVVGVLWGILQPFITMVVFTVVFGQLAGFGKTESNYALVVFAGVLPWQLFASGLTQSAGSLVGSAGMITKIYFPRLILPASHCIVSLVDFCLAFAVFLALCIYYQSYPGWQIVTLPLFLLIALFASLGLGLFLAALNVRFRDVKFLVPFLVQLGVYVSPVGFTSGRIPQRWRGIYALNPMVAAINGCRWALLGTGTVGTVDFWISFGAATISLVCGVLFFRSMERSFADFI